MLQGHSLQRKGNWVTYSVIVLTLKELSYLIHALHAASNPDIAWWDLSDTTKRDMLRELQDLIETQFFLHDVPHEALQYPHDDTLVTSSLFEVCGVLQQWIDTQISSSYNLHAVIPIDMEGAMVVVFTQ